MNTKCGKSRQTALIPQTESERPEGMPVTSLVKIKYLDIPHKILRQSDSVCEAIS